MEKLLRLGPPLFAIPMIAFGVQYALYGRFVGGLPPVPPWAPGGAVGAYITAAILILAGLSILMRRGALVGAAVIGLFFTLCVLVLHLPRIHGIVYDGVDRTRALEPLALGAAAFALVSVLARDRNGSSPGRTPAWLPVSGRWVFAICMAVFGYQHFLYAQYLATLVPQWMPSHLFWIYFTGAGFIVAALAIVTTVAGRMGATWLGIMFLLWTILLHAPRVAGALHNGDEWSSLFVALAMAGASLIIARTFISSAPRNEIEVRVPR